MLKLPFALVVCLIALVATVSCSAEDPAPAPDEVGTVEQALCPSNVYCPGMPAYSYNAGSNIACFYNPGGIKYVPKPAGCQECCPTWGTCTPGGCGGQHYAFVQSWTCRTGGSCSP